MANAIAMTVQGLSGALGMLQGLDEKTVNKLSKQALSRGLTVVKRAIKADRDIKTPRLKASVRTSIRQQSRRGEARAKVGVNVGKGQRIPEAHLYILGTVARYTRGGDYRGIAPYHDAVIRGYAASDGAATAAILNGLKAGVEREAQKGKSR